MHETINNIETQKYCGRGLFVVFYRMRPSTTLKHKIIVAVVCLVLFIAWEHQQIYKILVAVVSSMYFIAWDYQQRYNTF